MSQTTVVSPLPSTRVRPRWSAAGQAVAPLPGDAGLPASIAGLPARRACVSVGPPLLPSGPRRGAAPVTTPVMSPLITQPAVSWTRLYPCDVYACRKRLRQSGLDVPAVLPAMMLLPKTTVPKLSIPPASLIDAFAVIVT